MTISGTKTFSKGKTFKDVGIIKKSYCGSFSTSKPSLRLDFAKYIKEQEDEIEKLIGTKSITLNNCKQDPSFIRQPLGYELFRQAGVPTPRGNFAKVIVNGVSFGPFFSMEQYKKTMLKNNFDGNGDGNLYELDAGDDLDTSIIKAGKISFESGGDAEDQKDLLVAAEVIAKEGLVGAKKVIDYDAFIKLYAMETIMKHRDGFTINTNNTYLYNDAKAVDDPKIGKDINLKFIPCGIDQLLREKKDFEMGTKAIIAKLIIEDPQGKKDLLAAIKKFATTIFSKKNHDKVLKPYIDRLEALVADAGALPELDINSLRHELKLVRSGAYQHLGEIPSDGTVFVARVSGVCIPTDNKEYVPEPTASSFGDAKYFKTGYFYSTLR